jgi:hypothetical protein
LERTYPALKMRIFPHIAKPITSVSLDEVIAAPDFMFLSYKGNTATYIGELGIPTVHGVLLEDVEDLEERVYDYVNFILKYFDYV